MSILFAILIFSFLIFIHEFGHFITAKLSGVQVNEFSMFMGPAIWKKQKGETLYSIRCIPIGGYCAMEGEDGDSDNPRAFGKTAWWKRLIILIAGAAMNFLAGLLIVAIVYAPAQGYVAPEITHFEDYATVDDYGLQVGDRFVEIDGSKVLLMNDVDMLLMLNEGDYHDLVVERNGRRVELTAQEYALLFALMEKPDVPVSREQLLRKAWGYQSMGETRTVDVHVQRLRKKLGGDFIETVYKCGYRLRLA